MYEILKSQKKGLMKRVRRTANGTVNATETVKVTEDMLVDVKKLVKLVNSVEGPIVKWDRKRRCYGLKAHKDIPKNKVVTFYEGF